MTGKPLSRLEINIATLKPLSNKSPGNNPQNETQSNSMLNDSLLLLNSMFQLKNMVKNLHLQNIHLSLFGILCIADYEK